MKTFCVILLVILQIFIGLAASLGKLRKPNQTLQFPRNITFLGWSLMASCFICLFLSIAVYFINEDEQNNFQMQLSYKDSINAVKDSFQIIDYINKLDSSNKNTIELLAKYGLKIDSTNFAIKKIKDSSVVIKPSVQLCTEGIIWDTIINNTVSLYFKFCSTKADAEDFNLNIFVIHQLNDTGSYFVIGQNPVLNHTKITDGGNIGTHNLNFSIAPNETVIYFYMYGTYRDSNLKIMPPIDQIISFTLNTKGYGFPLGFKDIQIRNFLRTKHIIK